MLQCAKSSVGDNVLPDMPVKAMRLLRLVLANLMASDHRLQDYLAADSLVQLVEDSLKITLETGHSLIVQKCMYLHEALKLARLLCHDESLRSDLLEVISCVLCSHIAEFQMLSNPISASAVMKNGIRRGDSETLPKWSVPGLKILVELLLFLREQVTFSEPHAQLYRKILEDKRFRAFFAFGLISDDSILVEYCLNLTPDLMTVGVDQAKRLSENIVAVVKNSSSVDETTSSASKSKRLSGQFVLPNYFHTDSSESAAIDELIKSFKAGNLQSGNIMMSQVIDVYERKLAALQMKEKQVNEVLRANKKALQQNDRLLINNQNSRQEAENEAVKLRSLLHESERKSEKTFVKLTTAEQEIATLTKQVLQLNEDIKECKAIIESYKEKEGNYEMKITNLQKALETSKIDMESEKEYHNVLRKHYDQLKNKFETNSCKLMNAEEELNRLRRSLKEKDVELQGHLNAEEELAVANKQKEEDISCLEKNVEKLRENLQVLEQDKKMLQQKNADLETDSSEKSTCIKDLTNKLKNMEENIAKFNQITQVIHQMTGEAVPFK
ncbi:unnamed protein product [Soboliphyme baturini]|uniref:Huntingtin n=1 Tax=Soboliphyme baturini TaxID=241478 RepID=A0A183IYI5_9BILA|nr:unnamed protein product [Soboliphyme baturini]